MEHTQQFDIAIIGAGPAGCSAALTIKDSKHSIALFEKAEFPRAKTCGDGICDRSINTLNAISPAYVEEFLSTQKALRSSRTKLFYKGKSYLVDFRNFGYVCQRIDFDNFLFSLVQRDCKSTTIFQNCTIKDVEKRDDAILLKAADGTTFLAKMVLVCNGTSSPIARKLTGAKPQKDDMGFAIRAYYTGVTGMENGTIELHYKKEYFPGYLWIFPGPDGVANVGFGCKANSASLQNTTAKDAFAAWIANDDELRERFANAQQCSPLQGGLIPYNIGNFNCHGDRFCVCGDAASLIDPISGGGIGSAMLSGHFAAKQAEQCMASSNFASSETEKYTLALRKRVEKEMNTRGILQKTIGRHLWLLDVLAFVGKSTWIFNKIKNWYL